MRRVSAKVRRGGALLALLTILIASAAYADEPMNPADPLQGRIRPPVGSPTTQDEPSFLDLFFDWVLMGRIRPPIG
jgi:hypothetical protein